MKMDTRRRVIARKTFPARKIRVDSYMMEVINQCGIDKDILM